MKLPRLAVYLSCCVAAPTLSCAAGNNPNEKVLYDFMPGSPGTLDLPSMILDATGSLIVTTANGGPNGEGEVFMLTPPKGRQSHWQQTILHDFTDKDGQMPEGNLLLDASGAVYGTTFGGGRYTLGTVYKLSPPRAGETAWKETTLYAFGRIKRRNEPARPATGLVSDSNGNLYGTTFEGGKYNQGAIFRLSPPTAGGKSWTETTLDYIGFPSGNGNSPRPSSLTIGANGALFGTTEFGGSTNLGTIFELSPPQAGKTHWTQTLLHLFTGSRDGGYPDSGLVADGSGALYGATGNGGFEGTVYKLAPTALGGTKWTKTILFRFFHHEFGYGPIGELQLDAAGNLYGTTYGQYPSGRGGGVFELSPPADGGVSWTETTLYSFLRKSAGEHPTNGVVGNPNEHLFAITSDGGKLGAGTILDLSP